AVPRRGRKGSAARHRAAGELRPALPHWLARDLCRSRAAGSCGAAAVPVAGHRARSLVDAVRWFASRRRRATARAGQRVGGIGTDDRGCAEGEACRSGTLILLVIPA